MVKRLKPKFGFKVVKEKKRTLPKQKTISIFLFRHGMTSYNRDRKFTGWLDSKLTKQGFDDAKIVAKSSEGLGESMKGLEISKLETRMQERGV